MEHGSARIIDGISISGKIMDRLKENIKVFTETCKYPPGLAIILNDADPSGMVYARQQKRACKKIGIDFKEILMPVNSKEEDFLAKLKEVNNDERVHGVLLQLPLPKNVSEKKIIEAIEPSKDVDCIHPLSLGKMFMDSPTYYPCTPYGIYRILELGDIEMMGKHVVIVGRSNIVGKPLAAMLLRKEVGATVTVCHSGTENLPSYTSQADILVVSIGKPEFIKASMVKEGAIVIDVGINVIPDSSGKDTKIVGDVDFCEVSKKAGAITPVPGGVGPVTVAVIMENTFRAAEKTIK